MSDAAILARLGALLPPARLRTDADTLASHGRDWTRLYQPDPLAVAFPESVAEVQALVAIANDTACPLVPSGGRTGLSGGAVAKSRELVLSFERMNRILGFDAVDRSVTAEPGVILETLQDYAREHGLQYPVDFAARGSAQLGGTIATNAGGIKVIRWGMTRDWVSGLKVVTGRGELLDLNRGLVKNNTGYDLRQLFIGSEGTLGLIVEATVRLAEAPQAPAVMVLGLPDLEAIMSAFERLRAALRLTAFECFSAQALSYVTAHGQPRPFETKTPWYVLAEYDAAEERDTEAAMAAFETLAEDGVVLDGVLSQSDSQWRALWRLREDITESIAHRLPYKNDVSVRVARVPEFLRAMDALFAREYPDFEVIWFGHVGDGNLHISVLQPPEMARADFVAACEQVSEHLFATLAALGGSISAEHGVGLVKKPYLSYSRDPAEISYLRAIRAAFDPNGILNPGKLFDPA